RTEYADPTVAAIGAGRPVPVAAERGKQLFDELRVPLRALEADLDRATGTARADLADAASRLQTIAVLIALGLVVLLVVLAVGLRRVVSRPISALAGSVRRVADGDFDARVVGTGPREVVELGDDVDTMRRQIVAELGALRAATERLDQQAQDLERSNSELEQFAYVASHDLQEPLRKVASFTQLLERRYSGQLDDRADQYIAFAVDGAKRMQVLINDLLAFSRVGRLVREHVEVDAGILVDQALGNLSLAIEEAGAEVTRDELPRVSGDATLLTGVFQNLIGNAVKFRGDAPPRVHVGVADAGDEWEFCVADNGIGIESEYADRIFVIFQRLHPKDAYPGTGIGLAMCRKIIEYHGGRIWLDTDVPAGTTFRFTLPKLAPPSGEAAAATVEEPETAG
ncbi:MAG TPA: ATP-binding protein, partial [Mycobacteriales bacterium]|nr:ATP-binding protein [Mycobacteriales bacterium]